MTFEQIINAFKNADFNIHDFAFDYKRIPTAYILPEPFNTLREQMWSSWSLSKRERAKRSNKDVPEYDEKEAYPIYLKCVGVSDWITISNEYSEGVRSSVKYFPEYDIYIRVTGYREYDGYEYDNWDTSCEEVYPVQKICTLYLPKNKQEDTP